MNLGWGLIWSPAGGIPAYYGTSFNSLCIISGGSGDATWSSEDGDCRAMNPDDPTIGGSGVAVKLWKNLRRSSRVKVDVDWRPCNRFQEVMHNPWKRNIFKFCIFNLFWCALFYMYIIFFVLVIACCEGRYLSGPVWTVSTRSFDR